MHTSMGAAPALDAVLTAIEPGNAAAWHITTTKHTSFTCWQAWEHLIYCYQRYAGSLMDSSSQGPWLNFTTTLVTDNTGADLAGASAAHSQLFATTADLGRFAANQARILDTIVAATPPSARGWHPCGVSDAEGFAAMAVVETFIHGWDIVTALTPEQGWLPPDDLSALAIARLFPDAPKLCFESGIKTPHYGELLLHLCGRTPFGTHPVREEWQWDSHVRHVDLHHVG